MPRKIYDIKPPKVAKKIEKELKEFFNEPKAKKTTTRHKKEPHSFWWSFSIYILIIVVGLGTYLFFKLPKAEISIWPKVETLSFKQTIKADSSVASVDATKAIIPAKYFQSTKTASQDFPATGNASDEGKASGKITIYNKYDPVMPFTFRAGTHFMSDSGKLFTVAQKIVIPAAKKVGSKITPGSIEVTIQAAEGGNDYNIAPSNFSIPGLKGTPYYYGIYATSESAMAGGYAGKVKKVTDQDIQEAKDTLTKKTTEDAMADLKNQISSDYILLDNAAISNVTEASTKTKSGTIADSFNYQVTVSAGALAFKKSDIDQFVKNYIISQVPSGKTYLENSVKIEYSSSVIDISGGKATLNLDISSGIYKNIDKNSLAISLFGQNLSQISQTMNSMLGDDASKTDVKFWPFWVNSTPKDQERINIELKFQ